MSSLVYRLHSATRGVEKFEYRVTQFQITWDRPVAVVDQGGSKMLCCRGVQIDATINVSKFKPEVMTGLNRTCKYEVGFVQILDYSNQKALYNLSYAQY